MTVFGLNKSLLAPVSIKIMFCAGEGEHTQHLLHAVLSRSFVVWSNASNRDRRFVVQSRHRIQLLWKEKKRASLHKFFIICLKWDDFYSFLHSLSYKKYFSCACLWILGERKANTLSFTASGSDSCRTSCDTLREDPWLHHPARSISLIKKESSKPNPKLERASVSWIQIEACFHRRGAW